MFLTANGVSNNDQFYHFHVLPRNQQQTQQGSLQHKVVAVPHCPLSRLPPTRRSRLTEELAQRIGTLLPSYTHLHVLMGNGGKEFSLRRQETSSTASDHARPVSWSTELTQIDNLSLMLKTSRA